MSNKVFIVYGHDDTAKLEMARTLEKAGFEAVEINFAKAREYLKGHSMEQLESLIASHNLKVATLNAIFEINFCNEKEWTRVTDEFRFACELGQACI